MADPKNELFFDAATTQKCANLVRQATAADKHISCEKPTAEPLEGAVAVTRLAMSRVTSSTAVFPVYGRLGSTVAGLQKCRTQARVNTPKPV